MGAYLSHPEVEKISCDEKSEEHKISYGTSSMQGWRVSQEVSSTLNLFVVMMKLPKSFILFD